MAAERMPDFNEIDSLIGRDNNKVFHASMPQTTTISMADDRLIACKTHIKSVGKRFFQNDCISLNLLNCSFCY